MITPWKQHQAKWKKCKLCDLCEGRTQVVLAKGKIPADVVFLGEAPGPSEDVIGLPFVGPAGHLLDSMLKAAGYFHTDEDVTAPRMAFTNLVCCIPRDDDSNKLSEPPKYAIEACAPRLKEFIDLCNPKLVVCVGSLAKKYVPKLLENKRRAEAPLIGSSQGSRASRARARKLAAEKAGDQCSNDVQVIDILHPTHIMRADITQKGLMIQRTVLTLSDALNDLILRS